MNSIIGLIFEIAFLLGGLYLFLVASGRIKGNTPAQQEKIATFRKENGNWLTIVSAILILIMLLNIGLHIVELTG